MYNSETVAIWQNFSAGCVNPPDFYTFLSFIDEHGNFVLRRAIQCQPDEQSLLLAPHTSQVSSSIDGVISIRKPEVGALNSKVFTEFESGLIGGFRNEHLDDIHNYDISL